MRTTPFSHFILTLLFVSGLSLTGKAQLFTTDQIMGLPYKNVDDVASQLEKTGWEKNGIEMVTDSNFIRRSWKLTNKMGGADSYMTYYDFTKDTAENYVIYQFSERAALEKYRNDLKSKGYKLYKPKKSKKKDVETNIKEKEDVFYIEKKKALVIIKEVFLYGLNCFVIYPYKPGSEIAKGLIADKVK